jgi:hypothetical protein
MDKGKRTRYNTNALSAFILRHTLGVFCNGDPGHGLAAVIPVLTPRFLKQARDVLLLEAHTFRLRLPVLNQFMQAALLEEALCRVLVQLIRRLSLFRRNGFHPRNEISREFQVYVFVKAPYDRTWDCRAMLPR